MALQDEKCPDCGLIHSKPMVWHEGEEAPALPPLTSESADIRTWVVVEGKP